MQHNINTGKRHVTIVHENFYADMASANVNQARAYTVYIYIHTSRHVTCDLEKTVFTQRGKYSI